MLVIRKLPSSQINNLIKEQDLHNPYETKVNLVPNAFVQARHCLNTLFSKLQINQYLYKCLPNNKTRRTACIEKQRLGLLLLQYPWLSFTGIVFSMTSEVTYVRTWYTRIFLQVILMCNLYSYSKGSRSGFLHLLIISVQPYNLDKINSYFQK